ncbi:The GLUG motif-containing protein, partial [Geoalkalibacter ferrihydriticus]
MTGRNDYVGGLIGTIDADPTIANSYWDTQTSGMNTSAGGEGRTTAEMQRLLTFEAWMGEDSPWTFSAGTAAEGYEAGLPYLSNVTREEDRPQFRILFGGGWGDNETPYSITDWNQLQDINVVVGDNFSFKLVENLDTSTAGYALQVKVSETLANGGKGWEPIGTNSRRFIGHFDGNGYTIRNLMINRPTENYVGLFGATENANLLNLAFHDFDVTGNRRVGGLIASAENTTINRVFSSGVVSSTGTDHSIVGGLAGETLGATSIENTWFGGDVTAISRNVGGLVGLMAGSSSIQNSYVTANVRIVEQSNHGAIGGLVGSVDATATGKIENSYATGSVIATNTNTSNIMNVGVGGLVGQIRGSESGFSIVNSYAVGTVGSYSGSTTNAGGLVGVNNTTNAVINSFWDIHKSGITTSAGGEGKTTTEMHTLSTFSDWTVDGSPWTFTAGGSSVEGYEVVLPYLTDVTREEDRELSVLFAGGWGGLTSGDSDGTPYTITDWNQLQNINAVVGGNFSFQLSNSLDAETTGYAQKVKDGEVLANNGAGWKPIGSVGLSDSPFVGIFDGGGHTISNLTINRPQDDYIGLFGATQNAAISNLILSDVDIRGDALVGSVVGEARNTHLENIAVTSGMVTGFLNVGGLAGWFEEATISKSYAMGDVTGEARVGGLAGNLANGEISESYATGNVTGNELVGGLIGTAINASTVEQSYYSTGTVAGNFSVGGLVGEAVSTTITDSYAHGSIISADKGGQEFPDEAIGGLVGKLLESSVSNSYAVGQISPSGDAQDVGGLIGHAVDSDVIDSFWDAQLSGVYTSAGGEGKTTTEMHALSTFSAWNGEGSPWTLTAGASAVAGYEVVLPYLAHVTRDEDRELSVLFAGGWGNGETPYAITNWNQLQNINAVVGEDFSFKLSNNLDVSITGYAQQVGEEDTLANDGKGWMPIGANATRFTGTFDGGGHTINNLIINMAEADDVGLFGVSDNASLRNLTLYNAEVTGKDYVGGLVGRATDTSIENIHIVGGRVGALRYVGGVVGQILTVGDGVSAINTSSSSASVISTGSGEFSDAGGLAGNLRGNTTLGNSWASGDVTAGFRNVGGLVGFLYGAAVIENSYATGDVKMVEQSSHGAIGGLVGSVATDATGKIKNSYATGNVIAPNSSSSGVNQGVGGLVGQIRDSGTGFSIINSYAIGTVGSYSGSTTNVGGLVGVNKANPTIANSFWDTQTSGITTSAGGEGKTTTQMHTLSTFSNWNVDGSPWTLTAGGSAVEGYEVVLPYLTNVTREEDRVLSVLFDGGWGGLTNGDADGTPYTITDWDQLQNINAVVDQGFDFVLQNDLDADTVGYTQQVKENELLANDGKGWAPIGSWSNPAAYTGTFDGNNKTISGLIINRPNEEDVGLFGTAVDATIGNLTLSDVDILGGDAVGSVVGMAGNTHLENITVTGGAVAGTYDVGGLVGVMTESLRTIVDSHANVSVSGNAVVGGLVGSLYGSSIINSSASGSVNGTSGGPRGLGGLVGGASSGAQIIGSHATGDVESGAGEEADSRNFGGLVGLADDNVHIENSYATGNVVGGRYVGGLVGWMGASLKTIQRSYATGDVMGTEGVGGLVGFLDSSTISESYATGDVTGIISVGGLAGLLVDSVVNESYAAGNVTGNLLVGGLAGEVGSSTVEQSFYSPGTVAGNFYVGGLVGGAVGSTIDNSYAQATIIEADREGMLIPDEVGFDADFAIGGLVGILLDSTVSNSYAAGQISHADDAQDVGGLIGLNAVFGEDYQFVPRPTNDNITNSFWDTQVSGLTTSAGGEGKTTAEMQILSTFNQAGWNIERDADLDNIFPFLSFTDDGNGGYTATWVVGKYLLNFALSDVGADGSIIYDGQAWLLGDYWAISEDIF